MPPVVLVIHGVTQCSEWYLEHLKKCEVLRATDARLKLIDFKYGENPDPIIKALDSGDHTAAIVCDLSIEQGKFTSLLGSVLKRFVFQNGGRLAFPTTEGLLLNPVLKTLFQVPWNEACYYGTTWGPRRDASTRLDIVFPIHNFLPQATRASKLTFHAKACSYVDVPEEDRCYGVTKACQSHSELIRPVYSDDDEDGDSNEGAAEDPYEDSEKSEVVVAVRNCGAGKICFFGDVNAGNETTNLVFAFCLA